MVDAARPLASMPATRLQAALQLRFCVLPKKDKIRCMDENTSQVTSNQRDLQALLESLNGGIPVHAAEVQRCERCAVSELPKCCRQKTETVSLFALTASFARAAMVDPIHALQPKSPAHRATGTAGVARGAACTPGRAQLVMLLYQSLQIEFLGMVAQE